MRWNKVCRRSTKTPTGARYRVAATRPALRTLKLLKYRTRRLHAGRCGKQRHRGNGWHSRCRGTRFVDRALTTIMAQRDTKSGDHRSNCIRGNDMNPCDGHWSLSRGRQERMDGVERHVRPPRGLDLAMVTCWLIVAPKTRRPTSGTKLPYSTELSSDSKISYIALNRGLINNQGETSRSWRP